MPTLSILVADDAADTRNAIAECLRTMGHEVTCAAGGNQAIERLADRSFDLLITDLLMPDADGLQVIMEARKSQPGLRVIAMSGGGDYFSSTELLKLAGALGADVQLRKPFSREQLLDAVEPVCGIQREFAGAA